MQLATAAESREILTWARRIAVIGIKPASRADQAAHYIPGYLAQVGYDLVPVPIRYPEVDRILARPVHRSLETIPGRIDIVSLFLRPERVCGYLDGIVALRPRVVWFQSGLLHRDSAAAIAAGGIRIVHACIGCRRAEIAPPLEPLAGQRVGSG